MIIDAHVHIWPAGTPIVQARHELVATIETLLVQMNAAGVNAVCAVTSRTLAPDNSYLLEAMARHVRKVAVVGVIDPFEPGAPGHLAAGRTAGLCGVRFPALRTPNIDLNDTRIDAYWRAATAADLTVCLHMAPELHGQAFRLAKRFPSLRLVVDHLGRPDPERGPSAAEYRTFLDLARCSNVACKLPNPPFFSRAGYPFHDLLPFYRAAMAAFGSGRVMWASDWPWVTDTGLYRQAFEPLQSLHAELSVAEWADLMAESFRNWFPLARI